MRNKLTAIYQAYRQRKWKWSLVFAVGGLSFVWISWCILRPWLPLIILSAFVCVLFVEVQKLRKEIEELKEKDNGSEDLNILVAPSAATLAKLRGDPPKDQ